MPDGRFALVVATSRYSDGTLTTLEAPARDAESLAEVLSAPEIGGFDVQSLLDRPAAAVMQELESFFGDRRRDDLVLLYFSGHGILDDGARLYFATTDTRVDRPRSTAVAAAFVNELMNESRSRRQVLVLDCCNSGAFARGVKAGGSIGTGERFEGRGKVVITASDALQYAFEGDHVDGQGVRSIFTHVLVDGLQSGEADLDRDGYVGLDELYDYVYGRVLDASPHQRPRKWAFDVEGQIYLARTAAAAGEAPAPPVSAPSATSAATSVRRQRRRLRRRYVVAAAAAVLAAGAALAGVLLTRSSHAGAPSPAALASGREVTLRALDAWRTHRLSTLDSRFISASARRALSILPTDPVTPVPPGPHDCFGTADNVGCDFGYPGLNIGLESYAVRYPSGMRLNTVICLDNNTDRPVKGGMAACARIVANS